MATQDQVIINFSGIQYVMPSKAGMAIFAALSGSEVYRLTTTYEQVAGRYTDVSYIRTMTTDDSPKLQYMSPVQFHIGLENQRAKDEAEAAKEAAKVSDV